MQSEDISRPAGLNRPFMLVVALFVVYGLIFIYRTSFMVGSDRYFVLFDDAMVSMRYAKNLAGGYGLVWNPGGPHIEGYTNPLWVLFMAGWHLLPIAASKISLAIQLSALLFLTANLFIVRKIALVVSEGSEAVALGAVILTGFYMPLDNWSLQGMEVSVLVLLVSIATLLGLDMLQTGRFRLPLYILLAVGTLVRLDVVILYVAFMLFFALANGQNRRLHLLYGALLLAGSLALQTAFRLLYYNDILPNTYYLKVEGFPTIDRILHGLYVFWLFASNMNLVVFLGAFSILIVRRDKIVLLLCWLFVSQSAYSIYVGGDAWEFSGGSNRFISIVMPLFMVLLSYSTWSFVSRLAGSTTERRHSAYNFSLRVQLLFIVLLLVLTAIIRYIGLGVLAPAWVVVLGAWLALGFILRRRAARQVSAANTGQPPGERSLKAGSAIPIGLKSYVALLLFALLLINLNSTYTPAAINGWLLLDTPLHVQDNEQMVLRALAINRITQPDATFAVVWAGIMPYFADRTAIDLLGKNDRTIAHEQMRLPAGAVPWRDFLPGHMKYDYNYSIGRLQPDVVTQFWPLPTKPTEDPWALIPGEAGSLINNNYTHVVFDRWSFYLRQDSPRILWSRIDSTRQSINNPK